MAVFLGIILVNVLVVAIVVLKAIFPTYIEPKMLTVRNEATCTQITYRALKAYDVMFGVSGLTSMVTGIAVAVLIPQRGEAFEVLFMGVGLFTLGIVYVVSGYTSISVVTVSSAQVRSQHHSFFGIAKREQIVKADIVRVYYAKELVRQGEVFSVFADTTDALRMLLVARIHSERVAVEIKDAIITHRRLLWSSRLGKGPMLQKNWPGEFRAVPGATDHTKR